MTMVVVGLFFHEVISELQLQWPLVAELQRSVSRSKGQRSRSEGHVTRLSGVSR